MATSGLRPVTWGALVLSTRIRIADPEGTPIGIGVDHPRRGNPRLTPLAIKQMFRKHRDSFDAPLAERGYVLTDYADQGPGREMEFEIGIA